MPDAHTPHAQLREHLRLLVRLFAVADSDGERERLMRDIERVVLHLGELIAMDNGQVLVRAANHDDNEDQRGAI